MADVRAPTQQNATQAYASCDGEPVLRLYVPFDRVNMCRCAVCNRCWDESTVMQSEAKD
jgi:hypothetical protein